MQVNHKLMQHKINVICMLVKHPCNITTVYHTGMEFSITNLHSTKKLAKNSKLQLSLSANS